jgi:ATP-dependent protease HslVU (ClpYQ) ATPase subunit
MSNIGFWVSNFDQLNPNLFKVKNILIAIDSNYVKKNLGEFMKDTDLSKFIL